MAAVLLAMAATVVMTQQHEAPPPVCEYPGVLTPALNASSTAEPVLMSATCSTSASLAPGTSGAPSQLTVAQSAVARLADPQLYTDTREMVFDMSPRSSFVGAGRVKVASVQNPRVITEGGNKTGNIGIIIASLRAAKADGALIATLTEEVFEYEPGQEQPIDGPGPTAVRQAAKDIGIAVVCPMRLLAADGRQYNAAIVIHANGSLAKAAYTGSEVTQKQFPVLGWPVGAGPRIQKPENHVVPGQLGTSVFDMPGIGRIAIVMCFDVNFPEAWYNAYALGAQIVFWPAEMGAPDRDVISYARLFRFHVVACGHSDAGTPVGSAAGIKESGMILDTTGETVADIKPLSAVSPCGGGQNCPNVVTGTLDLDAEWVHENGPGTNCQVLQKICKTYPGVFEFIIAGCGGETQGKGGLSGCTTRAQTDWWQRGTAPSNSVMLFASRDQDKKTVRAAFDEVTVGSKVKVVPWRDYIFANRQGINSLRQYGLPILPFGNMSNHPQRNTGVSDTVVGATSACQFPGVSMGPAAAFNHTTGTLENAERSTFEAALRPNFTCSPGLGSTAAVQLAVDAKATAPPQIYRNVHEFTYDMSKRTSFAGAARVKVASLPGAGGPISMNIVISQLKEAKADGALIATLTEESFGYSENDPGQPIDGPGPTAVRQAAKDIGIAVVCPMRLLAADGRQYNAAIVIHANGSLAKAAYTGSEVTQKQFPVYGYPLTAPGMAGRQAGGETNVVPGQLGTSVFDMPGIGRIAILMCFDVNFPEAWYNAYALGAQIVFWPTVMGAPDRDVISYARLFRFHVVACGSRRLDSGHMDIKESGMILDTTGETVADIKALPSKVVTGTVDLDAEWLHSNGPGLITEPSLTRICAAYPGIYEFIINGEQGPPNKHPGCSARTYNSTDPWQRGTAPDNNLVLLASKFPEIKTVKKAAEEEGFVPWRDYIFAARKGINSLRLFGLPGLVWGGVEKGPLPAPPLPPLPLPRPLGNIVTAAIITTPELMNPSVVPTSASAVVRAVIEEYANSSQSLALIDATKMTAAQLKPFKVAIVLVALPSSDTLLEFAAAGGAVLVVGGSCRSDTKLQAALGITMNRTADIRTTNADLNVTTRKDKFADAWNLKLPTSRGPSMPVMLTPVSITPNAESFEIANVTIGGATHPWLVARRFGSQYGMLNYLSVPEPISVRSAVKFIFSSTGLGAYMSRTAKTEEYTTDQYGEPISVDDPWSQVAVDHVPASLGLPDRYRVTLLKADPSRWTTKKEYKVMHNKSLCINLYTRWYGRQAPGMVVANISDGINVVAAQTYRYTTACVSLTHAVNTAPARQTSMRSVSPAAPVAHPNSFCCGMIGPSTCSDNAYKYVGNVSVQQCASECTKLRCPCFDYIAKIAHPGFSNCRVLPANVSFKVDSSPSGETAYTTAPVPPPPAAPSSLHLPVSFELLGPLPEDPAGCKSDLDCELNGICSKDAVGAAGARRCECDAGWYGSTCGRLDLLPAHRAGIWPTHRGHTAPFGAAPAAGVGRRTDQAMSWGGSVVQDRETKKYHGFFDTGCFDTNSMQHCSGYQLAHGVSDSLDEPFELHSIPLYVGPEKTAAKSAFNPHVNFFPDGKGGGDYVLFFTAAGGMPHGFGLPNPPPYLPVCSGAEVPGRPTQPNASATYVPPTGSCDVSAKRDGMGTVCALHAKSLDGPWALKGVFAVAGGAMGGCNPVAIPLRNGSVLFASGIGGDQSMRLVPGANEERLGLSISDRGWDGTYHAVPAFPKTYPANAKTGILWPELNEPTEDQTLWQDKRGFLHILMHGNQWAGEWPSMHAYSRDGSPGTWQLSKRTDGYTPYSANVSWAEGGWTNFFRRERPELNFNEHGEPAFLVNSVMFGRDYPTRQFSFTILQRVHNRTTPQ